MSAQVGIGVTLITVDGRLQISAIKPEGSAAASARICVGDYLVAINGVRLNFEAHAKELILGAYGTSLEVEVSRSEQSRTVTLWRGGTDAQMNGEAAEKAKAAAEASATATHLRLSSGFNKHLDSLSGGPCALLLLIVPLFRLPNLRKHLHLSSFCSDTMILLVHRPRRQILHQSRRNLFHLRNVSIPTYFPSASSSSCHPPV